MRNTVFVLSLLVWYPAFSQNTIRTYVESQKQVIRTTDPADTDYSDLDVFGNAVGDKRVVFLGEQDHGDAPSFLAKTRLIKYLHEKKGFNVLAFESDFFGMNEGLKGVKDTLSFRKYMQANIFTIWTYCDACHDLFYDFLPAAFTSSRPVTLTGFDNQPHSWYSKRNYRRYLDSVLTKDKYPLENFDAQKAQLLDWTDTLIKNYGRGYTPTALYTNMDNFLQQLVRYHTEHYGKDFTCNLLMSIKTFANQSHTAGFSKLNIRDAQMAANLNWLVNVKYKGEKIIVWAHNYHVMDKSWDAMGHNAGKHYSMGNEFLKDSQNREQSYVLGFDSKTGTAGRITVNKTFKVRKPKKSSAENWFGDDTFSFIDFANYNRSVTVPEFFYMKGKAHQQNALAQWTRCFDGVFYIRDMYPCKR
ncbi:MAG: erythromycin esterase family protein [Chitinophagaceae bacterium]